jgi:hypothetical protein
MDIKTWNDEELADELTGALEYMALQYLSDVDGEVMNHDCMIAGERCLEILEALGKVKTEDGIHYTWVEETILVA